MSRKQRRLTVLIGSILAYLVVWFIAGYNLGVNGIYGVKAGVIVTSFSALVLAVGILLLMAIEAIGDWVERG